MREMAYLGLSDENVTALQPGQLFVLELEVPGSSEGQLSLDEVKKILAQAVAAGLRKVIFREGGRLLNRAGAEELFEFCADKKLKAELFLQNTSLDAASRALLARYGCPVVFEMLPGISREEVRAAARLLNEAGAGPVSAAFVLSDANLDTIAADWRYLRSEKIAPRLICATSFEPAADVRYRSVRAEVKRIEEESGVPQEPLIPFAGGACFKFRYSCFVRADGTVYPCYGLRLELGNCRENDLPVILAESHMLQKVRSYRTEVKAPCRGCEHFSVCGGCRGRAWQYSKDYNSADPGCERIAERLGEVIVLPYSSPASYIPHRKPMLMVSSLCRVGNNSSDSESVITEDNIFLDENGYMDPVAYIEIGAQSMAFLDSFMRADKFLKGMLVEVNRFVYTGVRVHSGDRILVRTTRKYDFEPWHIAMFTITAPNGSLISEGELKVCQLDESMLASFPQF